MAAKKARKREYIPPSSEVVNRRERTHQTVRTQRPAAASRAGGGARAGVPYPVPSLRRTLKRLPIYFVMIFALQYYLLGTGTKAIEGTDRALFAAGQAGIVTIIFAPFMHVMDRFAYNRYLKRAGKASAPKG